MKKVLATLLAICLMLSAVGTAMVVSAEDSSVATEETVQTPVYTASTKDWTFANVTVYDNTLFDSAYFSNYALTNGKATTILTGEMWTIEDTSAWIDAGKGEMRFWVKLPYKDGAPEISYRFDLAYKVAYTVNEETKSAYPAAEAIVPVKADGLWHEIRIGAASFVKNSNFRNCLNGTFASPTEEAFYALRITPITADGSIEAKGGFYVGTSVEYYDEAIAAELNDGNVALEQVVTFETADGGWSHKNVSKSAVTMYDHKFYNKALKYTVSDAADYSFSGNAYPFKNTTITVEALSDYFKNQGDIQTFVKNTSGHEMTFKVGIKLQYTNSVGASKQAETTYKTVTIPGDDMWHEVRVSYGELFVNTTSTVYKVLTGAEGTLKEIYLKVDGLTGQFTSTDDELYITPLAIYNRNIVGAAINANVVLEQISSVAIASGGWSHSNVTKTAVNIGDNKFYRTAYKFGVSNAESYSFSGNTYPYINTAITVEELTDYFKYHGDMRTYVKNTSGHAMTFSIGVKIKFNSSSNAESRFKTVEIPGDGKWHEVRIAYSDIFVNTTDNIYKAMTGVEGYTLNELYMKVNGLTGQFTSTDDEILFTPLEIYNRSINTAETTDFAREYNQSMLLNTYRSDKTNANVSKVSEVLENESPFFSNAVTYTANDTYTAGYTSGQIGFVHGSGIDTEAFADWYYNDNADLRIWVKAENGTKIKLGVFLSGNNYGEVVTGAIDVAASSDWQLVTVPRSAFNSSNQIVTAIAGRATVDVNIFFYAVDGTFAKAGDSISIAQCVEAYSDKAYDKGDANCDDKVDIMDLIRVKKQAAASDTKVKNSDIDNSGAIDSQDLVLITKKLLSGAWN